MRIRSLFLATLIVLILSVPVVADDGAIAATMLYQASQANNVQPPQSQSVGDPNGTVYFKDNGSLYALYPNGTKAYMGSLVGNAGATAAAPSSQNKGVEDYNQTLAMENFTKAWVNLVDDPTTGRYTGYLLIGAFVISIIIAITSVYGFGVFDVLWAIVRIPLWLIRALLRIMLGESPWHRDPEEPAAQTSSIRATMEQRRTEEPIDFACRNCGRFFQMTPTEIKNLEASNPSAIGLCPDCGDFYEPMDIDNTQVHTSSSKRRLEFKEEPKEPEQEKKKGRGAFLEWKEKSDVKQQ